MMTTKIPIPIVCTGIIGLTAVELYALSLGYNGTLLKLFIVVIAAAIGASIPLDKILALKGGK